MQTKFILGIVAIFVVLAASIAATSVGYVNTTTIREAENRVRIYLRSAWEIHDGEIARITSAAEILAQGQIVDAVLQSPEDRQSLATARRRLEAIRQEQELDILDVIAPDGTVLLRTRSPYNDGDSLFNDPLVRHAMLERRVCSGNVILELERLDTEGGGLVERCLAVGQEPRGMMVGAAVPVLEGGELIGVLLMGNLLNGTTAQVDRIRDAVFENEYYKGKPVGTATVFMGDLRVSTNVQDNQGRRAVGTRASQEVAEQVLGEGVSWTGRAFVVDTWYLSQYDPIRDPDGEIIGMLYVGELEQKYLDLRARAVASYLLVIVAGMVLALAVFTFITRSILRPIRRLAEATECLSGGDLSHRVEVWGKDEVGNLSASFNEMAGRLEEQRREIEVRQQELEDLSAELRQTNHNYMEMLGFVTHELKNPLSSAVMSLYTVKDGYLGELNPAQQKSLASVAQSLDYFHDMIKNYLDLSRLEKGELEVHRAPVSLRAQVIAPVVEGLERELRQRRMVVDDRVPEAMRVDADANLLRIVYDNLLSNAIKYGREGGAVVLDALASNGQVTLSVQNDGEGIPSDKMPLLFAKFSRLHLEGAGHVAQKGTGLGLYICKEIVERHGGRIWADSKTGEWVRMSFTLPN